MKKHLIILLTFITFSVSAQENFDAKRKEVSKTTSQWKNDFKSISSKNLKKGTPNSRVLVLNADSLIIKKDANAVIFFEDKAFKTDKNAKVSFESQAMALLNKNKAVLNLNSLENAFVKIKENTDDLGFTHLKMQQMHNGVPYFGGEIIFHGKNGVERLNGKLYPSIDLEVSPEINSNAAIKLAFKDLGKIEAEPITSSLLSPLKNTTELVVYYEKEEPVLAYYLTIRPNVLERWNYMIDANTGEIIYKVNQTCTLDGSFSTKAADLNGVTRTFNIIESSGTYFMIDDQKPMFNSSSSSLPNDPVGAIWTIDGNNSKIQSDDFQVSHVVSNNGTTWDKVAVSAHSNASICYDYFRNSHQRNSLDGKGSNVVSIINLTDEDGSGLDNAFWNGEFLGYGNGGDAFYPLAGALDVAAHEMTHGVIENTANLEYRNQSGALNESFADIFGVLIDSDDWTLGEDIVKTSVFPSGALRSLQNPNQNGKNANGYQPANMSQYAVLRDTPSEDNGGVHINSGITNHAFYLFATSNGVGLENAGKVYYRALTNYLTRTSKFIDARIAVVQSAKDLYGDGSTIMNAAKSAFDQVGITDDGSSGGGTSGGGTTDPVLPVNPGEESMVVYDPIDGSMYAVSFASPNDLVKIADKVGCLGKPSVTDNGSYVYFVGKDENIYRINLNTLAEPEALSSNGVFRNVAISKNGRHLAALASEVDNFIYIFDLETNENVKFELYNPTYTEGVSTGEVLYADTFEWEYSGENIIYDAFNQAKSLFGNIEYWDVGIIKAWDNEQNDFGTGDIDKLFNNLDEGENIGNPALAKTNKNVLAFDFFDSDEKNYIVTANFETGKVNQIIENNAIAYPDFSKADDLLSFNTLNGELEAVDIIGVSEDKTSTTGSQTNIFTEAKWGVWYALGERAIPTKVDQVITFDAIPDQNAGASVTLNASSSSNLAIQYILKSGDASIASNIVKAGQTPGKVFVNAFQAGNSSYNEASAEQSFCIIPGAPSIQDNGISMSAIGGTNYQWYVNGKEIGGVTSSSTINKSFAGTYSAKSVTSDGCYSAFSNSVTIIPLATEPTPEEGIRVFPNPAEDAISIVTDGRKASEYVVYDINGNKLLSSSTSKFSIQHLKAGVYVVGANLEGEFYYSRVLKK